MKVSADVKAAFDKLKAENARLKQLVAALESAADSTPQRTNRAPVTRPAESERVVQTTQATAKRWKAFILSGGIASLVGFFLFSLGMNQEHQPLTWLGGFALTAGMLTWLYGRFGKFWHHE